MKIDPGAGFQVLAPNPLSVSRSVSYNLFPFKMDGARLGKLVFSASWG